MQRAKSGLWHITALPNLSNRVNVKTVPEFELRNRFFMGAWKCDHIILLY